jgi:4-amino-4-deoxy-L-arabinose transferase-like glycosyltransferase
MAAGLIIAYAGLYIANLTGALYIDEVFYARTGLGLWTGSPYMNPTHAVAPTAKYAIGAGQLLFGQSSFGVRLPVVIFAVGTLALVYGLGAVLRNQRTGLLAVALVGATSPFATHAVVGQLDVPLAFGFVGMLYAAVRWLQEDWRYGPAVFGIFAALTVTTKIYGLFYAMAVALPVAAILAGWQTRHRQTVWTVFASALTVIGLLFVPYYVIPHPPVPAEFVPASLAGPLEMLLAVPIIGNLAYIGGAAFVQNVLHIGSGHAVVVGSTVYQYPPIWTYGYWLFERGGVIYLLLIMLAVGGAAADLREGPSHRRTGALVGTAIGLPLVTLSALTVKWPRYIVPLYPVIAVVGISYADRLAGAVHRWVVDRSNLRPSQDSVTVGTIAFLATLMLVTPSPVVPSATDTIAHDSGFDDVSTFLEGYNATGEDDQIVILAYHNVTLSYYFEPGQNVTVQGLATAQLRSDTALRERIRGLLCRGEVDLLVDKRQNRRIEGTFVGEFRRQHTDPVFMTQRPPADEQLVVLEVRGDGRKAGASAACGNETVSQQRPSL